MVLQVDCYDRSNIYNFILLVKLVYGVVHIGCGDMRSNNFGNFGIVGKINEMVLQVDYGDMRNVDTFGDFGIVGKISNNDAVGRLWQHEFQLYNIEYQYEAKIQIF